MNVGSWPRVGFLALTAALGLSAALPAAGQTPAKPGADASSLERAQRQADQVFHWIKVQADKSAERAAKPAPAPAPVKRAAAPPPPPPAAAAAAQATVSPSPVASTAAANPVAAPGTGAASAAPAAPVLASPSPEATADPVQLAALHPGTAPSPAVQAAVAVSAPPASQPEPEAQDDSPIKLISRVEPVIPRQLQPTLRNGFAQVRFKIEPDGSVSQASTIKASHARLGDSAVEAIKQWRFEPIKTAREVAVEIVFSNE